jgi:undecaprenyl-diphosphatase
MYLSVPGEEMIDAAAHRGRHLRAWRFQIGLLLACLAFGVLALLARTMLYFPLDLELTRAIQAIPLPWLGTFLDAITWIGFPPQSNYVFGGLIVLLFLVGRRLESLMLFFAAAGSISLWYLFAPMIDRPRPSPELVNVAMQIPYGSFPSGHVVNLTAIFGFLAFLVWTLLPARWWRGVLLALLGLPILTVGFARIHAGAHWPSDVLAGYLLGGIWLALSIHLYRWAKQRLSARHGQAGHRPSVAKLLGG